MKKITLLLTALLVFGVSFAQLKKYPPKVIIIGVGEKNPTFDESRFPHIKFYYTPTLKPVNDDISEEGNAGLALLEATHQFTGEPEFVRNFWNLISSNKVFMLFDKESRCYTLGPDILPRNGDLNQAACANDKVLGVNVKDVIKKGKTVKQNKKAINLVPPETTNKKVSISFKDYYKKFKKTMVGNKLPDFEIVDPEGNPTTISAAMNNEPTLVLFFEIPKNLDLVKAYSEKVSTGKAALSAMAGSKFEAIYIEIEAQIFKYKVPRR
jgi:uncharacterized protein YnzC (UPF0291/DUF896 family)